VGSSVTDGRVRHDIMDIVDERGLVYTKVKHMPPLCVICGESTPRTVRHISVWWHPLDYRIDKFGYGITEPCCKSCQAWAHDACMAVQGPRGR
jgi:hypothetical protein